MSHTIQECDVFVVGGGPAGSTIAALLAQRGRNVVVCDKDRHPRFHIGESLLPQNMGLFERLGISEEVERIGLVKRGAEFNSPAHEDRRTYDFGDAFDKRWPYGYQVRRSQFDHLLLDNARRKGAKVHEGARVRAAGFTPTGPTTLNVEHDDGTRSQWRAQFLVDASGRDTFLANLLGFKRKNRKHNSAAIYGHFTDAQRLEGAAEGNISIFWFAHGWFWFIPLKDGTTSIGAVCWPYYTKTRKTDPTQFLLDTIALCPELAARLSTARLTGPATATGNYSYECTRMAGERYLLVGDAWAFVDPVFSSGVYLAMNSAALGADVVDQILADSTAAPRLTAQFERDVRRGLTTFSWFIYRMTSPIIRRLFMDPRNALGVQDAVTSLLAGQVFERVGPVRPRLWLFRFVYYANCLASLPTAVRSWRDRKRAIQAAA
ncbi:MAG: tryptophan 7-halogenase [Betaproteobacteria bacterium]|nr:tryptophan 7-halogenase [Betaproteobacteria bacterium]